MDFVLAIEIPGDHSWLPLNNNLCNKPVAAKAFFFDSTFFLTPFMYFLFNEAVVFVFQRGRKNNKNYSLTYKSLELFVVQQVSLSVALDSWLGLYSTMKLFLRGSSSQQLQEKLR
jgi:hypothetical protein